MQFFDLSRQFAFTDVFTPQKTLHDLAQQDWYLSKIRVEYDCLQQTDVLEGQAVLSSSENIHLELDWIIQDTGHELQVLFKGIETENQQHSFIMVKGAELLDENYQHLSAQALSLWIEGTLFIMLPHIRREIKSRLNLWDYVEYED